jgi:hypothetical protein
MILRRSDDVGSRLHGYDKGVTDCARSPRPCGARDDD